MCEGDPHPQDANDIQVTDEAPQPDPVAELEARFRTAVEQGDFRRARHILEQDASGLDSAQKAELTGQLDRLRPDRAAVVTAAVCGLILVILAVATLFH